MLRTAGSWIQYARALLLFALFLPGLGGCQNNDIEVALTVEGMWDEIHSLRFSGTLKGVEQRIPEEPPLPEERPIRTSLLFIVRINPIRVTLEDGERAPLRLVVEAQGAERCILATATGEVEVARGEVTPLKVTLARESQKLCRLTLTKLGVASGTVRSDVVAGTPGLVCGEDKTECSARFPAGQPITLRAAGGPSAHFGGWGGPCSGRSTSCTLPPISGPVEVTAQFDVGLCTTERFCWESPLPQGNTLRGIDGIGRGQPDDVAWAVGTMGTLLQYRNGGWYGQSAALSKAQVTQTLYGVAAGSASEAWAVGASGTVLRWDGSTWQRHPQSGTATTQDLLGAAVSAPGQAWAVGGQATILQCSSGTCTLISANDDADKRTLQGVHSFAAKDAWAVGVRGVVQRFDSTATWAPRAYAGMGTLADLSSVWGTDSRNLWAVGQGSLILRYDGTSWTQQNQASLGTASLFGVWGVDAQRVWAVGNGGMVVHTENGRDWQASPLPEHSLRAFHDVWGRSADAVFIVGQDGVILRSQGTTFGPEAATFVPGSKKPADLAPREPINAVSGTSAKAIWAVGQSGMILRWNGERWLREDNPDEERRELLGISATQSDVWAVGKAGIVLHRKAAEGSGWELSPLPQASRDTLNAVAQSKTSVVAVGNLGKIWRRLHDTTVWVSQGFRTENLYCAFGRGAEMWIGGDPSAALSRTIYTSSDDVHMDWTPQVTGSNGAVRALWGGSDGGMWAGGDGFILRMENNKMWSTSLSMAGAMVLALGGSGSEVWAAGNAGLVLQRQGTTWSPLASGTSNNLTGLFTSASGELVLVGARGTILRHAPPN